MYASLPVAGKRAVADRGVFVSSAVADIATLEGGILVALSKHGLEIVVAQGCACFWDRNLLLELIQLFRTEGGPDKIVLKLTVTLSPVRVHEVREADSTVDSLLPDRTFCVRRAGLAGARTRSFTTHEIFVYGTGSGCCAVRTALT